MTYLNASYLEARAYSAPFSFSIASIKLLRFGSTTNKAP